MPKPLDALVLEKSRGDATGLPFRSQIEDFELVHCRVEISKGLLCAVIFPDSPKGLI